MIEVSRSFLYSDVLVIAMYNAFSGGFILDRCYRKHTGDRFYCLYDCPTWDNFLWYMGIHVTCLDEKNRKHIPHSHKNVSFPNFGLKLKDIWNLGKSFLGVRKLTFQDHVVEKFSFFLCNKQNYLVKLIWCWRSLPDFSFLTHWQICEKISCTIAQEPFLMIGQPSVEMVVWSEYCDQHTVLFFSSDCAVHVITICEMLLVSVTGRLHSTHFLCLSWTS